MKYSKFITRNHLRGLQLEFFSRYFHLKHFSFDIVTGKTQITGLFSFDGLLAREWKAFKGLAPVVEGETLNVIDRLMRTALEK